MNPFDPGEIDKLREGFASLPEAATSAPGCPDPQRLWAAACGELRAEETHELVDHVSACAACAEDWRIAADLARESGAGAESGPARSAWARWSALAAAAAVIVVAFTLVTERRQPPAGEKTPTYRQPGDTGIRSLLAESELLPRGRVLLRWSPGSAGARYSVDVTTEDLTVVSRARGLAENQYLVPHAALANLPPRARLLWRVTALAPDGRRTASETFVSRIE